MKNSFFSRFTPKEPKFFPLLKQLCRLSTQRLFHITMVGFQMLAPEPDLHLSAYPALH